MDKDLGLSREHELLLQAALWRGEKAIDSWKQWRADVDIDGLDLGSRQLLPLLYRNLIEHEIKDSLMKIFKGIYRVTWYKNQMLFHGIVPILRSYQHDGMQCMLLKGAAMILMFYQDYGLRTMGDIDILVPSEHVVKAIKILRNLNWNPAPKLREQDFREYSEVRHAHVFKKQGGDAVDLHWYMVKECCYEGADYDLWEQAVQVKVKDIPTHAPNPTDQLMHICVHGQNWNRVLLLRKIVDSMAILNSSKVRIDWDRLLNHTQKRQLILPLRKILVYIHKRLDAPVPSSVLCKLHTLPVIPLEWKEDKYNSHPPRLLGVFHSKWIRYQRYVWGIKNIHQKKAMGITRYLQYFRNKDNFWQLIFYVLSQGMKRLSRARKIP